MLPRLLLAAFFAYLAACSNAFPTERVVLRAVAAAGAPSWTYKFVDDFVKSLNAELPDGARIERLPAPGDTLEAVRRGDVELAIVPSAAFAARGLRGFFTFEIPFTFSSMDEVAAVQRSIIGDVMLAAVGELGLVGLGHWNAGMRFLFGRDTRNLLALRGSKVRIAPSPQLRGSFQALGAHPVEVPGSEAYAALQRGAANSAEMTPSFALDASLFEFTRLMNATSLVPEALLVVANATAWEGLPFRVQWLLSQKVKAESARMDELAKRHDADAWLALKERGVQRVEYTASEVKAARQLIDAYWTNVKRGSEIDGVSRIAVRAIEDYRTAGRGGSPTTLPSAEGAPESPVFFATDRKMQTAAEVRFRFGTGRGSLVYGRAAVEIEGGTTVPATDARAVFKSLQVLPDGDAFVGNIVKHFESAESRELLLYVHGYNNTFTGALATARQLAHDLKFPGAVVVFSWPSDGAALRYGNDANVVELSRDNFLATLETLGSVPNRGKIHLLVHSMGSQLVTAALEWAERKSSANPPLQNLVFAAPDVFVEKFRRALGSFTSAAARTTLYASAADQALLCANLIHQVARAGQAGPDMVVEKGLDTVDASGAEPKSPWRQLADLLPGIRQLDWLLRQSCREGHAYMTRNFSVLNDLHLLIRYDSKPQDRVSLRRHVTGRHWEVIPAAQ